MKSSPSRPINNLFAIMVVSSLLATVQGQTSCSSSADCEDSDREYCSNGTCLLIGSCQHEADCFNRENNFASDKCVGYLECKNNQCTRTCSDSFCKPDSNRDLFCPAVMCRIEECEGAVSCVNYNCYNCDVIYFDAKGSQICNGNTPLGSPPSCSSNEDCHAGVDVRPEALMALDSQPYCAAGTCALPGKCNTDLDCVNPSNHYDIIECAGPIVCQQGECTRDCSTGSMCKEGVDQTYCLINPCDVSGCAESTGCVADYCSDGCDALHFDATGNVLAVCNDPPFQIPESCTSDKECNDEKASYPTHYCSSGTCKAMGMCEATSDCLNPSNDVGFAACTGYNQCTSDGQCEHVCSNDQHCCFIPLECTAEEKEFCPEAVTCVKDNCNDSGDHCGAGTGTFYFDSAGNSICTGEAKPTLAPTVKPIQPTSNSTTDQPEDGARSCSSSADCEDSDREYCSNGTCLLIGSCQQEADCFNRENNFASDKCVGYLECKNNQCTRTCSDSFCKPDSDHDLFCPAVMCRIEECEGAVSCVNYNCYNCDVIYFDAKGSQICGNTTFADQPEDGARMIGTTITMITIMIATFLM